MDPSQFTAVERRFVLAEIVKSSDVDVDALFVFIRANNISPQWMQMQLPHGRNMSQCMQVFEHLSMHLGHSSDRSTSAHVEPGLSHSRGATVSPKRNAALMPDLSNNRLLMHRHLAPIAPRPVGATLESHGRDRSVSRPRDQNTTKKRGRPSKADMAKRDLKPLLPKPPAPRPTTTVEANGVAYRAPSQTRETTQTASPDATPATPQSTSSETKDATKRRRL